MWAVAPKGGEELYVTIEITNILHMVAGGGP
jgi:hypothetical protein